MFKFRKLLPKLILLGTMFGFVVFGILLVAQVQRVQAVGPVSVHFAVVGDYGLAGQPELDVANIIKSWTPDFVITVGDNNYDAGGAATNSRRSAGPADATLKAGGRP